MQKIVDTKTLTEIINETLAQEASCVGVVVQGISFDQAGLSNWDATLMGDPSKECLRAFNNTKAVLQRQYKLAD